QTGDVPLGSQWLQGVGLPCFDIAPPTLVRLIADAEIEHLLAQSACMLDAVIVEEFAGADGDILVECGEVTSDAVVRAAKSLHCRELTPDLQPAEEERRLCLLQ